MTDDADLPPELSAPSSGTAPGLARLTGRRVLVVGGGTRDSDDPDAPPGNGRAIAVIAAREGADVVVADRSAAAAEVTAELVRAEGRQAVVVEADVSSADECDRMMHEAVDAFGGLDGIVLNVGIGVGRGLAGTSAEEWDLAFAVNLRAHFLVARRALDALADGGGIVFIGSVAGLKPGTRIPSYDSTKAGLAGLMRHTAVELAPTRRANMVVPGVIDTPLGRAATGGRPSRAGVRTLLGRQGTAWEVAYAVTWLLSTESSYVTAQSIVVDGGLSAL